jgi:hypothetical protein
VRSEVQYAVWQILRPLPVCTLLFPFTDAQITMSEKEEREKAFMELQARYASNLDMLRRVRDARPEIAAAYQRLTVLCALDPMQVTQAERSTQVGKQRLELVLSELKGMPEDVPTYKQVGRA